MGEMDNKFKKGDIVQDTAAPTFKYEVIESEPDVRGNILLKIIEGFDKEYVGRYVIRGQEMLRLDRPVRRVENGMIFGPKINRFLVMERSFIPLPDFKAMEWRGVANCATYEEAQQWIEAQGQTPTHMFRIDKVWMAEP